jgi:Zn-finger nucleic acid-binding protein
MRCPVDNETLVMSDRHGVEIDYCPKCRGVWLDRGELDKIIERAAGAEDEGEHGDRPRRRVREQPAQRQLARAQLKVLVVVTLGRLFARGGHLGETREAAM